MQTISRLYANEDNARKASDDLKRRGFADTYLFTPPARGEDGLAPAASAENIMDSMVKAYIVRGAAAVFAKRVSEGSSLVTVHAPFSGGQKATTVLDRYGPIDSGVPEPEFPARLWDEEHPFSSAFAMPLLAKCEHPFETISGVPSLAMSGYASGVRPQRDNPAPLSTKLGLPLLTSDPAPLSSMFRFPLLTKKRSILYR